MKNLRSNPMKAFALTLVLVLLFSMTAFASQVEENADSSLDADILENAKVLEDGEEQEKDVTESEEVNQTEEAVLTDEVVAELEASGIEVNPYALTANISTYDELLTVLSFPVFEGVIILNDIEFEDRITLDRDFTFTAAAGLESVTLYSAEKEPEVTLKFTNVILDGNGTSGGIYSYASTAPKTISGVTIQNCYYGSNGAAIYVTNLHLSDSVLVNNKSKVAGGAMFVDGNSTITDTIIENNYSNTGSGICVGYTTDLTITNTEIKNNSAGSVGGAGIYFNGTRKAVITDNFTRSGSGGGLYLENTIDITLENTIVIDNSVLGYGGGFT